MKIAVGSENNKGIRLLTINVNNIEANQLIKDTIYKQIKNENNIYIVCVGTNRSTGDSFAPFVGTYLEENNIKNVIGTIDNPCHASNLDERLSEIPNDAYVIALDASLSKSESIGNINIIKGQLEPGIGVNKRLTSFGDLTITYNVNIDSKNIKMNYKILSNTKISVIIKGAKICAKSITDAIDTIYKNLIINNEKLRLISK